MIERPFQCRCCIPPRQIYYQSALFGPERAQHEEDHSPAVPGMTAAERKVARVEG